MSNVALFSGSNVPAFAKKTSVSSLAKSLAGGAGGGGGSGRAPRPPRRDENDAEEESF